MEEAFLTKNKKRRLQDVLFDGTTMKNDQIQELMDENETMKKDIETLRSHIVELEKTNISLSENAEKHKQLQQEAAKRNNVLVTRLTRKEHDIQELLAKLQELQDTQTRGVTQFRNTMLDPAVNLLIDELTNELSNYKKKLEEAENELLAYKFTPDSATGKKLLARCRTLLQENQELGKQLSQGRISQLEAELNLQKQYNAELKSARDELKEFVVELDEEVEGMQATINMLQQDRLELKEQLKNATDASDAK